MIPSPTEVALSGLPAPRQRRLRRWKQRSRQAALGRFALNGVAWLAAIGCAAGCLSMPWPLRWLYAFSAIAPMSVMLGASLAEYMLTKYMNAATLAKAASLVEFYNPLRKASAYQMECLAQFLGNSPWLAAFLAERGVQLEQLLFSDAERLLQALAYDLERVAPHAFGMKLVAPSWRRTP